MKNFITHNFCDLHSNNNYTFYRKKLCEFFEQEINLQPRPLPRETQKINDAELEQSMSTEKEDNHQGNIMNILK